MTCPIPTTWVTSTRQSRNPPAIRTTMTENPVRYFWVIRAGDTENPRYVRKRRSGSLVRFTYRKWRRRRFRTRKAARNFLACVPPPACVVRVKASTYAYTPMLNGGALGDYPHRRAAAEVLARAVLALVPAMRKGRASEIIHRYNRRRNAGSAVAFISVRRVIPITSDGVPSSDEGRAPATLLRTSPRRRART